MMIKLTLKGIILVVTLFLTTASFAQIFGKGQPGYVVLKDGTKLEGFVKKGAYINGKLSSVYYASEDDGDYKRHKLKRNVIEYSLNGYSYIKAAIKMSLVGGRKEKFCEIVHKGTVFTVVNHPDDKSSKDNGVELKTMFYVKKKGSKDFKLITRILYSKSMKKLCKDNKEWNAKVESDPKWLSFDNRIENFQFYEEVSRS